jgi:excisionase family DNA binding protein
MAQPGAESKAVGGLDGATPRLLRIEEVARQLAISRSMAWKLVAYGELRSVRIGRAVRVRPADLQTFVDGAIREG